MITVIKRPLLTEKAAMLAEKQQYAFEVTTDANKIQIKTAIEKLYEVKVSSVRTVNVKGKNKTRFTKKGIMRGTTPLRKKAYVTLAAGYSIDLVGGEGNTED